MATQDFKGEIAIGKITAEYRANVANAGADNLSIQFTPDGGQTVSDLAAVPPGGSGKVTVSATKSGELEVWIGASTDDSKGNLTVKRDGVQANGEQTQGSVRWGYSVAAPQ